MLNNNKNIFSIVAALMLLFAPASFASAHVLKTDGSIGAVMHIDPDDDPIVGMPATFFFEIKDKQSKFSGGLCDCRARIEDNGKERFSTRLFQGPGAIDLNNPVFTYTFPERGIYSISISGKPQNAGAFQPFTLTYDIRVDRSSSAAANAPVNQATNHTFHYVVFGGAFIVILFLFLKERRKTGNKQSTTLHGLLAVIALTGFLLHGTLLDSALCFHDHPVMEHHQCCAISVAVVPMDSASGALVIGKQIAENTLSDTQIRFDFNLQNKSPPIIFG